MSKFENVFAQVMFVFIPFWFFVGRRKRKPNFENVFARAA